MIQRPIVGFVLLALLVCSIWPISVYARPNMSAEGFVTVDKLSIRSGPGSNYDNWAYLVKDDHFIAVARKGGWLFITFNDGTGGWIYGGGVKVRNPRRLPGKAICPAPHGCDPNYPTIALDWVEYDLDCPDLNVRRFATSIHDPHGFDGDGDGIGCE